MNKTTENFLKAIKEYKEPETKKVIWKLAYDVKTCRPLFVTTEDTDAAYIEITREEADTYPHQDPRVTIVDGKIHRAIKRISNEEIPNTLKVFLDKNGNIATDDYSMLIINSKGTNRWKYE